MAKVFLHMDEQSSCTREGKCHGPELPKYLVPVFDYDPPLVVGMAANIYLRQATWWGGRHSVILTVSTTQPGST